MAIIYNMNISRSKLVVILLLAFCLGTGIFAYVKYKKFSEYLISRMNAQTGKNSAGRLNSKDRVLAP